MPPAGILVDGLVQSCIYITMAFGMVLVFSILGILNWTHGQFYMLGAFVVYYAVTAAGIPFPISILISGGVIGGLGMLVGRYVIERVNVPGLGLLYVTGATIALSFFFEGGAGMLFGLEDKGLYNALPGVLDLGSFSISYQKIAVVIFTLVIMAAMYIVLNFTKIGLAIRAAAQEPGAASLYGISVGRLSIIVMGIGCALAGMAGAIIAPVYAVNPFIGGLPMMMALLAIIIGGIGSLTGAILGGLILGFFSSIVPYYLGYISELALFLTVITLLIVRPQGLFGVPIRR
ncbi:MAG: branched-chain amino acid ABC transporter permease [Dehalococcoidia bacterium]|nr:branched-chain amino acid ABC transporter permease [Dehalococcoidia bacterium]